MTAQEKEHYVADALTSVHKGANWFYWIVGLSVVNLALAYAASNTHFLVGMSMTEILSAFFVDPEFGGMVKTVSGALILLLLGLFLLLGRLAHKPSKPAFIVGMLLYSVDGIIYLFFGDYLPAAFHAYVLFHLFMGYQAIGHYNDMLQTEVTEEEPAYVVADDPDQDAEVVTPEEPASDTVNS